MQKMIVAMITLVAAFAVTGVTASSGGCHADAEDTLLTQDVGDDTFYVTAGGLNSESNGQAGLQSEAGSCSYVDENGETQTVSWLADASPLA